MGARRKATGVGMRAAGPGRRAASVLLAATIATLGSGLAPIAHAQQDSSGDSGYYETPPPVVPGMLPDANGGRPLEKYKKTKECVQRSLGENVDLLNKPWGQMHLQLDEVHRYMMSQFGSAGGGQRVAVIDTGVTPHPYFEGRVEPGGDYVLVEDPPGPGLVDCDGHGTEVAGIIAADPPNDVGFQGVAPDARIVSIRQSSQNYAKDDSPPPPPPNPPAGGEANPEEPAGGEEQSGEGGQPNALRSPGAGGTGPVQNGGSRQQNEEGAAGTVESLAAAVVRAANTPGVTVMNISINNCHPADGTITSAEQQLQAAVHYAVEKNIVVVSAAGNLDSERCVQNDGLQERPKSITTPPWFAKDVLSVAAIDQTGGVADFSVHGPWVSVAAPGTKIISLDPAKGSTGLANLTIEGGNQTEIQGTSFAAPYVSGLVALVRQKYPDLDAREVMNRIKVTAQHPAAPGGRDDYVGHGVINPMAALTATIPGEGSLESAEPEVVAADLPPANNRNWTPVVVALGGAGGALVALLVTLFVVHTIRRNRPDRGEPSSRKLA
jgi:membrane-anchored mycosin MYCP